MRERPGRTALASSPKPGVAGSSPVAPVPAAEPKSPVWRGFSLLGARVASSAQIRTRGLIQGSTVGPQSDLAGRVRDPSQTMPCGESARKRRACRRCRGASRARSGFPTALYRQSPAAHAETREHHDRAADCDASHLFPAEHVIACADSEGVREHRERHGSPACDYERPTQSLPDHPRLPCWSDRRPVVDVLNPSVQ